MLLPAAASQKKSDLWQQWLDEVSPIMTRVEREAFRTLQTEEDRQRFQEMFWKVRASDPATLANEYREEFNRRLAFVKARYDGPRSDRGRIYIILGPPRDVKRYSGYENLVECELWSYTNDQNQNKPLLYPFMNLLFFKQRDIGDFRLFYPGIHTALDLLAPSSSGSVRNRLDAYDLVRQDSSELADASLSVIPGEGDPQLGSISSSSSYAIGQVFSLPEREVETQYVRRFASAQGSVSVSSSTRQIAGKALLSLSRNQGFRFLNITLLPEPLTLKLKPGNAKLFVADVSLHIRIEDLRGNLVFQDERKFSVKMDDAQKKEAEEKKVVFRDFLPLIDGDFNVHVTLINNSSEEFFTHQQRLTVSAQRLDALIGFNVREIKGNPFVSGGSGRFLVPVDPRFIFTPADTIQGIIFSDQLPHVSLQNIKTSQIVRTANDPIQEGEFFRFNLPLQDLPDSNYLLRIEASGAEAFTQTIHILPGYIHIQRPFAFEKVEPADTRSNYLFLLGQEYLNQGELDKAVSQFEQLPQTLWNNISTPVIARAYYLKKEYSRVLELLTPETIEKNYPVLLMLANSALELKRFSPAASYLEKLRQYGDTAEINQLLAAAYLGLGDQQKAKACYDRAHSLENSGKENKKNE